MCDTSLRTYLARRDTYPRSANSRARSQSKALMAVPDCPAACPPSAISAALVKTPNAPCMPIEIRFQIEITQTRSSKSQRKAYAGTAPRPANPPGRETRPTVALAAASSSTVPARYDTIRNERYKGRSAVTVVTVARARRCSECGPKGECSRGTHHTERSTLGDGQSNGEVGERACGMRIHVSTLTAQNTRCPRHGSGPYHYYYWASSHRSHANRRNNRTPRCSPPRPHTIPSPAHCPARNENTSSQELRKYSLTRVRTPARGWPPLMLPSRARIPACLPVSPGCLEPARRPAVQNGRSHRQSRRNVAGPHCCTGRKWPGEIRLYCAQERQVC